jgi:hypothetical protein
VEIRADSTENFGKGTKVRKTFGEVLDLLEQVNADL